MTDQTCSATPGTLARDARLSPSQARYAASLDALLAAYEVAGPCRLVETDPGPTFVLEAGAGQPVVFVHGTPATGAVWMPLLARLQGIRAIVVDRPSHGLSGDFEYGDLTASTIRAFEVEYLISLLDALGLDAATFVASSYGGLATMWLAIDRPQRVSRIVLAGAPPGMLSPRVPFVFGLLAVRPIAFLMRIASPPSERATKRFFRQMGDPVALLHGALIQAFTDSQRLPSATSLMRLIQRASRFPGRLRDRALWLDEAELALITQPVQFLWGPNDFVGGPDLGRKVVDAMPSASLEVLGQGHLPWLQDPAGAARRIQTFAR